MSRTPFDSSRAWELASSLVNANREVLLALSGAFLVLPTFALGVFMPPPEPQAGATMEAILASLGEYYRASAPALIGVGLVQTIGTLTVLTLLTDTARPTVGEAIRRGLRAAPSLIGAQLLMGFALASAFLAAVSLLGAIGVPALALLGTLVGIVVVVGTLVRLVLIAPAIVVDGLANPVRALQRSWQLTRRNGLRLLVFFFLLLLAFAVVMLVGEGAVRILFTLVAGPDAGQMASALVSSIFSAAMTVYFTAVTAACHRQLAE